MTSDELNRHYAWVTKWRGLGMAVITVVTCASLTGCGFMYSTSGSRSCDPHGSLRHPVANADYKHFIQWDGRMYVADSLGTTPPTFGKELGTVRCRFAGSRTPFRSEPRNRDAAFLRPGTPFFVVDGEPETSAIGAAWRGRRLLFKAEASRS